jgi:hypothetical protein
MAVAVIDNAPAIAFPRRLVYGAESVITQVAIRLWTIRGVWPEDVNLGLDHVRYGMPDVPTVEVAALVRLQVGAVEGVLRILDVVVVRTSTLAISVRVEVTDGRGGVVVAGVGSDEQLGIWGGYAPGSWYTLTQIGPMAIMRGAP